MIELSSFSGDAYKCSFASRGINNIFCNKFYTAGILTVMIIVIIMVIYPCKKGTSLFIMVKLAFYVFIVSYVVIFIHDGVIHQKTETENENVENEKFIKGLGETDPVYEGDNINVSPIVSMDAGDDSVIATIKGGSSADDVFAMYGV